MTLLLASAARATVGGRSGQEDSFRLWPAEGAVPANAESGGLLAVLADGMGGHTGGAIAGQTACNTFTDVFSTATSSFEARLKTALHASNEALAKGVEQNAALKGMGCTIIGAWIDDLGIRWTSVGDSLLLLYRLPDVIRLNADHSLGSFLDEQARQNKITRSEARRNRNRNALRSALTGSKIDLIDLRSEPLELRPGDWVVLASDGICSLPGDEIADVIYRFRQSTPGEMADGLIAAVAQKGVVDQDNTTVVAVRVDAADDVPTRVVARPKGEEVDLRTRRIGVSRRGTAPPPAGGKARAAVWLAAAVALVFCAVALMLAVPSLRPTMSSTPESTAAPRPSRQRHRPMRRPSLLRLVPARPNRLPPNPRPPRHRAPPSRLPSRRLRRRRPLRPPLRPAGPVAPAAARKGPRSRFHRVNPRQRRRPPPPSRRLAKPRRAARRAPLRPQSARKAPAPARARRLPFPPPSRAPRRGPRPRLARLASPQPGESAARQPKEQERNKVKSPAPTVGQPPVEPKETSGTRITTDPLSSTIE